MGRYTIVVLKTQYKEEEFIKKLNRELIEDFGADYAVIFNTREFLQEEANFMNHNPDGLKQCPGLKRPLSVKDLGDNFFWLRYGEFHFKISGLEDAKEAINVAAVGKWISKTQGEFIDRTQSQNYHIPILKSYLNPLLEEAGYDLKTFWKI